MFYPILFSFLHPHPFFCCKNRVCRKYVKTMQKSANSTVYSSYRVRKSTHHDQIHLQLYWWRRGGQWGGNRIRECALHSYQHFPGEKLYFKIIKLHSFSYFFYQNIIIVNLFGDKQLAWKSGKE